MGLVPALPGGVGLLVEAAEVTGALLPVLGKGTLKRAPHGDAACCPRLCTPWHQAGPYQLNS